MLFRSGFTMSTSNIHDAWLWVIIHQSGWPFCGVASRRQSGLPFWGDASRLQSTDVGSGARLQSGWLGLGAGARFSIKSPASNSLYRQSSAQYVRDRRGYSLRQLQRPEQRSHQQPKKLLILSAHWQGQRTHNGSRQSQSQGRGEE